VSVNAAPPQAPAAGPVRGAREVAERARAAATTEPGRLRMVGAALALLVLAFGAVTAWQVTERADAAQDVANRTQPLSAAAANIYRYLADADTTASTGFLSGGQEPAKVRQRYDTDVTTASQLIARAAQDGSASGTARAKIDVLSGTLPSYTELVGDARADNRQGLPLGGAYLRRANRVMSTQLLPAAQDLYDAEQARLGDDYGDAKALPVAAWVLGVLALGALAWAQRRSFRRTNRVVNKGLAGATASVLVVLLWLVAGQGVARSGMEASVAHGADSLKTLNQARFDALQARGDENLALVALGGDTSFESMYDRRFGALKGSGGLLDRALAQADDDAGRSPLRSASSALASWGTIHADENAKADAGQYTQAVALVVAPSKSTDASFNAVDTDLDTAIGHETQELRDAVSGARGALALLPEGAALLCLLGAAAAVSGLARRLAEYR
jgi:hypothetical protein